VLLVAGVAAGILAAYLLTHDDGKNTPAAASQQEVTTVLRTVTKASGQTTTVTQATTTTPPATASPPAAGSGHSLNDAGYTKMQAGDFAGAVPLLEQAVRALSGTGPRDPYEAYANYNLGYSLLKLNRCGEAIPYLQKADSLEAWRHEPRNALKKAEKCA
jgi:TolA-binding protein